jgi:putative polyhydroxyalkanoate system protein
MADIDLKRIHNLGLAAARAQADRLADHLGRKFDLRGDWDGNVLRFERPGVSGSLALTDKDLRLLVSLGFLLKAMKGSIEKAVVHELDTLFAGTKSEGAGTRREEKTSPAAPAKAKKAPAARKKGG